MNIFRYVYICMHTYINIYVYLVGLGRARRREVGRGCEEPTLMVEPSHMYVYICSKPKPKAGDMAKMSPGRVLVEAIYARALSLFLSLAPTRPPSLDRSLSRALSLFHSRALPLSLFLAIEPCFVGSNSLCAYIHI